MPLPADFPPRPTPPPPSVPLTDEAWRRYHVALNRWLGRLMEVL
ncbi:hypothetical protein [Methylobacterium variabile]|jgi:hypothetical protein|nr:hypothetical protein [Methylobacterium variabile]